MIKPQPQTQAHHVAIYNPELAIVQLRNMANAIEANPHAAARLHDAFVGAGIGRVSQSNLPAAGHAIGLAAAKASELLDSDAELRIALAQLSHGGDHVQELDKADIGFIIFCILFMR